MQGVRFDPNHLKMEKKTKKKKIKCEKKMWSERDLTSRPSDYSSCNYPARLKLQKAITLEKFYEFFARVNQVIYSSSPIS